MSIGTACSSRDSSRKTISCSIPNMASPCRSAEIQETARAQNQDWLSLASDYAQRMLLEVFRPDDPVLQVVMPPETRQELEASLAQLPPEIFTADDSLGWVYQFWQRDEKERVNKSEVKIGADELSPVTQLFTEDYMVLFLLHNTLGAWWAAKRRAEGKTHELPGYEWTYLRLNDDGSPAAGQLRRLAQDSAGASRARSLHGERSLSDVRAYRSLRECDRKRRACQYRKPFTPFSPRIYSDWSWMRDAARLPRSTWH